MANDSRTLATAGVFRIVPERELSKHQVDHLRGEGLIQKVWINVCDRGVVLTRQGRDVLESHRCDRDAQRRQAFHAGAGRAREFTHDAQVYRAYLRSEGVSSSLDSLISTCISPPWLARPDRTDRVTLGVTLGVTLSGGANVTEEPQTYLVVLLGSEAGMRCGEIMALEWTDVDLNKRHLRVARSEWKGHVTVPKGGRLRYVPLTKRLTEALRQARHLRGARVLWDQQGQPLTQKVVQVMMRRVARRANVKPGVHILRHTFCSHLAMRGAPARAIQELAGHQGLDTTQRYMHLSPAALDAAIRLLDGPAEAGHYDHHSGRGEILEAAGNQLSIR